MSTLSQRFRAWEWPAALIALSVLAAAFRTVQRFVDSVDHCGLLFCDFVRHFRPMGQDVLSRHRPDPEFFYPPFAALFFQPFGALPPLLSSVAWGTLLVLSAGVLVHLPARHLVEEHPRLRALSGVLVVTSLALLHGFKWGQVSSILVALTLVAMVLREQGRLVLPATALALAISIKAYPIVVLVHPLLRRDYRFLGVCLGLTALLSLGVPSLLLGPRDAWTFAVAAAQQANEALGNWVWHDPNSQYLPHVLARLVGLPQLGREVVGKAAGLLLAGLQLMLVIAVVRARLPRAAWWAWTLSLASAPFLLETSWPHYFAFLPPAQVLVAATLVDAPLGPATLFAAPLGKFRRAVVVGLLGLSVASSTIVVLAVSRGFAPAFAGGSLCFATLSLLAAAWASLLPQLTADASLDPPR